MYDPTIDVCRFAIEARLGRRLTNEELVQTMQTIPVSLECHARHRRTVEAKPCPQCGTVFTPRIIGGKEQKFCSEPCRIAYREANSKKNNPYETDWTGRPLTPIQRAMIAILNRPLNPGEYVVQIGEGPSDYRIMTKSDKGRFTHNSGTKYRMVEDGNFQAHMELNPGHHMVAVCERCHTPFLMRPGIADNRFCVQCRAELRSVDGKNSYIMGDRRYIQDPDNPNANSSNLVAESVVSAQNALGRPLNPGEVVHHRDHDPTNNSPDNLLVFMTQRDHLLYHRYGEDLGCKLHRHPNGTHVTIPMLKQIVDVVPPEKRSIPQK